MKNVLIVDDDQSFLESLSDGLRAYSHDFSVITAANGAKAVASLSSKPIDLVVTDLKMPVIDGFELLALMSSQHPKVPAIVMTAFGTPEIEEQIDKLGAIVYIEKPLDFKELAARIYEGLSANSRGYINNISLPSFLQLIEAEKKTCTLAVKAEGKQGTLYFSKGVLFDAETGALRGDDAAYDIVCWTNAELEIKSVCRRKERKINSSLHQILMEAFVREDHQNRHNEGRRLGSATAAHERITVEAGEVAAPDEAKQEIINQTTKEVNIMAIQDKLKELSTLEGFGGVGLFTPTGEALAIYETSGGKNGLKTVGVLANNVLMNAQKASLEMGTGRGQVVHVEAEHAHFIVRCLNEGTDPLRSQPGKAHVHLVLFLTSDASIGLAKMKIGAVIESLAAECRA
jgi:DNA-binding response OmpR family regulator